MFARKVEVFRLLRCLVEKDVFAMLSTFMSLTCEAIFSLSSVRFSSEMFAC